MDCGKLKEEHERTEEALTVNIVSRRVFRLFLGKCENLFNCWKSSYRRFLIKSR